MNERIRFTVFTPTFNRAHTLLRVYESLRAQNYDSFEWLIVDDGSTDDSRLLLKEISKNATFPIRVICQENGGKHRAHNTAIMNVQGEFVVILDSDDELASNSLAHLAQEWDAIPVQTRNSIAGVLGHSAAADGVIVGTELKDRFIDGKHFELVAKKVMLGDKLPCYRSEVLRKFPFPEKIGCNSYVPEGIVWTRISEEYYVRCINHVVRIYHRNKSDKDSLMNSYKRPDSNSWGSMMYCIEVLNQVTEYFPRFFVLFSKAAINCTRYCLHSQTTIPYPFWAIRSSVGRLLWMLFFPIGVAVWTIDKVYFWSCARS